MTIRLATRDDYNGYYQIKCDSQNIIWGGFENAPDYEKFKLIYFSRISDDSRIECVCEIDNVIAGYLSSAKVNSYVEITGMGVLSSYSGRGIATEMAKYIISLFPHNNIITWISEKNVASQMCYKKNGFVNTGESYKYYMPFDNSEHSFYKWERKSAL